MLDVDGLFVDIKVADGTICIDVKVPGGGGVVVGSYRSIEVVSEAKLQDV
jgi:hypothetical protein